MTLPRSRVESANMADADFPLNNLPCGVFSRNGEEPRCGMTIGDFVLDLPFRNKVMKAGPAVSTNPARTCERQGLSHRVRGLRGASGSRVARPYARPKP